LLSITVEELEALRLLDIEDLKEEVKTSRKKL